jgi:hypothetical protein
MSKEEEKMNNNDHCIPIDWLLKLTMEVPSIDSACD